MGVPVDENGNEIKYKVELYNFGSFCIREGRVAVKGKSAGETRWTPIKYPTSLERVAIILLTGEMGIPTEWENADEFVTAINEATDRLVAKMEEIWDL
jgi:hypothetical protein